jgi:beta-N-acetylhexosaminidase
MESLSPHVRAALVPLFAIVVACAAPVSRAPAGPPSIQGRVTAVDRAGERIGSIRVEANPSESSGSDKAVVRITQGTEIVRADSARADFNALASGQWVRVWFTGPVRESYPIQADAARVEID